MVTNVITSETTTDVFDLFMQTIETGSFFMLIITIIQIALQIFVWSLVIKVFVNAFKRNKSHKYFKNNVVDNTENKKIKREYKDVSKDKLDLFNTDDIKSLKEYFYNIFIEFEKAYNNLDYNIMKRLSTNQLYHNYYTGISLDLKTGKKRIISDIEKKKVILYELDSTTMKQVVSLMIEISYIDYKIDKTGKVISGNRYMKTTEKFEVTFRKDFDRKNIDTCPNCGADVVGNKCDYCRSILKDEEFKISSIKKIIE